MLIKEGPISENIYIDQVTRLSRSFFVFVHELGLREYIYILYLYLGYFDDLTFNNLLYKH